MSFNTLILLSKKGVRVGSRKKDYAGNEYVLMQGIASLAVGDAVVFDEAYIPARLSTSTAVAQPVAVAMAANTSTTLFSWYQIYGKATVSSGALTVAADAVLQSSATAGAVDDTATAAKTIVGATSSSANSGGFITAWLNYPFYPNAALV